MLTSLLNVIAKPDLLAAARKFDLEIEALSWYRVVRRSEWRSFDDVRKTFPVCDRVGAALVFNIRHNQFRLIATVNFTYKTLWFQGLMTHKEYARGGWKKWAQH